MLPCVLPSWPLRIAFCLLFCTLVPLEADPPPRLYTVENYQVSLQPDFTKQRVFGEVSIRLHSLADTAIAALEFDAGSLVVTSVLEGNVTQSFERSKSKLFVVLSRPVNADEPRTITVRYEAGPAAGLKFFPDQIYTSIPSDWMPCNDVPSERATLHLTLTAPRNMNAAASGRLIGTRASGEQTITEWQLDSPADPSLFGFALGNFAESTSGNLHILAAGTEIPSSAQILQSTGAAMLYLAERTGRVYFCACKHSARAPLCDGTHKTLP